MDYGKVIKNEKYTGAYSEASLFEKFAKHAKDAGVKVVYAALILYYVLQDPETPAGSKAVIYGALGYLILPADLVPDALPVIGIADDFAVLAWALVTVASCIDADIKQKAKNKLTDWFGSYDQAELGEVDAHITRGDVEES